MDNKSIDDVSINVNEKKSAAFNSSSIKRVNISGSLADDNNKTYLSVSLSNNLKKRLSKTKFDGFVCLLIIFEKIRYDHHRHK
jgi:hypothetical protein